MKAMAFIISTRSKPPFSFLLFLLPSFFLSVSFLLVCNGFGLGLGLPCLSKAPSFRHPTSSSSSSSSTTLHKANSILALKEEIPIAFNPKFNQVLHFSQTPPRPMSKISRMRRIRSMRRLRFLQPSNQSSSFSSRAIHFFNSSPCNPKFFMTWISSLATFGKRELFSIETLFKSHPNACLLVVSNTLDSAKGRNLLKPFEVRGFRVIALSPNYADLFKQTPAEFWFNRLRKGEVEAGEIPIGQNLSNLLRLVLLYKYGGIYIDTDVLVMKSFLGLKNAIGAQAIDPRTGNWSRLNNAVLVFDEKHPLIYSFIEEFAHTFDGNKWGYNGPYLVSRVVSRVMGRPEFEFTVLPPAAFYPVDWNKIQKLFCRLNGDVDSNWVEAKLRLIGEQSFAIHLWNRQSRMLKVEAGSVVGRIMSECCLICK